MTVTIKFASRQHKIVPNGDVKPAYPLGFVRKKYKFFSEHRGTSQEPGGLLENPARSLSL